MVDRHATQASHSATDSDAVLRRPMHRPGFNLARFRHPLRDDRPGIRWWWQADTPTSELLRELRAISAAGFGEVEVAFSRGFWADDRQRDAIEAVLAEAERIEVGVAVTLGAEWPLRTPNTSLGTEHAAQELHYGALTVTAADGDEHPLPMPLDDPAGTRPARLLAVTVGRVVRREDPPVVGTFRHWSGQMRVETRPPSHPTVLAHDSLLDVTGYVDEGRLRWTAPTGDWVVFAFWMRDTLQGATSFFDRAAAEAATRYLEEHQLGPDALPLLHRAGTELFEDSLELDAASLFWSRHLLAQLREANGYDPVPLLPLLFAHGMCGYWIPNEEPTPDYELDTGDGGRVRADYYRLLTDRYISDHLLVLHDWAVSLGVRFKAQMAYGQNLEPIRSTRDFVRRGGRAEGESLNAGDRAPVRPDHPTWRFALDHARTLVGGAHQGGATRISSEVGAQFDAALRQTLSDLREMLDKGWAAGITKPFVHGFASQSPDATWPTQSRFDDYASESWNDTGFPQWAHWGPLAEYWARGTVVLETGIPRTDVVIHRDGFLTTAARGGVEDDATVIPELADTRALERAGFTVQYIDSLGLAEAPAPDSGVLYPAGPAYRVLVLNGPTLTAEAAENALIAAEHGLMVVLVGAEARSDPRFEPAGTRDERVRDALRQIAALSRTVRVINLRDAADAIYERGVLPRVAVSLPDDGVGILTQWRDAGSVRLVLAYNPEPRERSADLSLEGEGRVEELDLASGGSRRIQHRADHGRTIVPIVLPAGGIRVLALDVAERAEPMSADRESAEIPLGAWHLEVDAVTPNGIRHITLPGQGPADWRSVPDLATVSGTGRYRLTIDHSLEDAALELGELAGSAVVRVNGNVAGSAFGSGRRLALGSLPRDAVLEIEIATSVRNAVVAHRVRPRLGEDTVAHGLIGPVHLRAQVIGPLEHE